MKSDFIKLFKNKCCANKLRNSVNPPLNPMYIQSMISNPLLLLLKAEIKINYITIRNSRRILIMY